MRITGPRSRREAPIVRTALARRTRRPPSSRRWELHIGERPCKAGDGRLVDPRLRRQLERRADRRPPAEHVDRRGGLRQARSIARAFPRNRAARLCTCRSSMVMVFELGDPGRQNGALHRDGAGDDKPVSESTQATYYRQALALAFCQPSVEGMLLFLSNDERGGRGNSAVGIRYVDGTEVAVHASPGRTDRRINHASPGSGAARPPDAPSAHFAAKRGAGRPFAATSTAAQWPRLSLRTG